MNRRDHGQEDQQRQVGHSRHLGAGSTSSPITAEGRPKTGWGGCDTTWRNGSRTEELRQQLVTILSSFEACGQVHFAAFGTLIGVMRHGGMNHRETDNDLGVFTRVGISCELELQARGMAVFQETPGGITRVCKRCTETCAKGRGDRHAYTDIYTFDWIDSFFNRAQWINPNPYYISKQLRTVPFLSGTIPIPNDAERILTILYGKWQAPGEIHADFCFCEWAALFLPLTVLLLLLLYGMYCL